MRSKRSLNSSRNNGTNLVAELLSGASILRNEAAKFFKDAQL